MMLPESQDVSVTSPSTTDPNGTGSNNPPAEQTHPFRFGLRALITATGICGVQFALMRYFGTLLGLAIGLAICMVVLAGLLIVGVRYRKCHASSVSDHIDQLAIRLVLGISLIFCSMIITGGGLGVYYVLAEIYTRSRIQNELGFTCEMKEINESETDAIVVIHITSISPGSPFDRAGAFVDDVILTELSTKDFLAKLDEHHGEQFDITVASGALSRPLDACEKRVVTLDIPAP